MRFMHREWEEAKEVEEDVKNDHKEEHVKNDYKEEHFDDKRRKRNQETDIVQKNDRRNKI